MKSFTIKNLLVCLCWIVLGAPAAPARPSADLAKSPPMGWNSWNWHGKKGINETIVQETIDAMVAQGLRDAGYIYVVVDGGWRAPVLGPNGELIPDPVKFPHGIKWLADYAHARGLKFGLHTVPGTHDCGGTPVGGFGHESVHVKQFVEWELDFVKLDKCSFQPVDWTEDGVKAVYAKWSSLLERCGRDMVFSISAYVYRDWYPNVCHMARTTPDIKHGIRSAPIGAVFDEARPREGSLSVMAVAEQNNQSAAFAGHGYWNDPDMMVTGQQGLNQEEQKAHFALWCVMSAPLMLGNDPRAMTQAEKDIVLNRECIAVGQDPTEQGRRIKVDGKVEIWMKRLSGNRLAVVLLNRDATATRTITFDASDAGLSGKWKVRDLFGKEDLGVFEGTLAKATPPHGCCFLVISR